MTQHKITAKRPDTGKYWTYGKLNESNPEYKSSFYGGMKKTQELVDLIESVPMGEYINFSCYPDDGEYKKKEGYENSSFAETAKGMDNEEIPF